MGHRDETQVYFSIFLGVSEDCSTEILFVTICFSSSS